MTLKKTAARLQLLQAVADGAVTRNRLLTAPLARGRRNFVDEWDRGPGANPRRQAVTGRMVSYDNAGLVQPAPTDDWVWELTETGRALLVEWGGTP